MSKTYFLFSFLLGMFTQSAIGQFSPPGLDDTHFVFFTAVGINQNIGKKWFNQSYIGGSRFSDPTNNSLLKKPAIFIVEQQTYRQLGKHFQLGFCLSLRNQNEYDDDPPYQTDLPSSRREIRYYLRLFYRAQKKNFSFAHSVRPEWRVFYDPDWKDFNSTPNSLRYRFKSQVGYSIAGSKAHTIILANEFLFVQVDQRNASGEVHWSPFSFSEDRITTYYRHTFKKPALIFDIGMMQQLNFGSGKFISDFVHFAFDFIFVNPFGTPKGKE